MSNSIAGMRKSYERATLRRHDLTNSPIKLFQRWLQTASEETRTEANAFTLATVDDRNRPRARTLLLKGIDEDGFSFFSNYNSDKGRELERLPYAAMVFWWPELERQVRIEGQVQQLSQADSDEYYYSRPRDSQIGAHVSQQSQPIDSAAALEKQFEDKVAYFDKCDLTRPEHWGGYCLKPERMEFWQGRPSRLHDRFVYALDASEWRIQRLQP